MGRRLEARGYSHAREQLAEEADILVAGRLAQPLAMQAEPGLQVRLGDMRDLHAQAELSSLLERLAMELRVWMVCLS